jgi:SPFH domain/Band 7 family protein
VEEEPGSVVWILLTLSTVAVLALSSLRCVPPGHRIVATRRGIVSRVAGPGLFLRVPVADRVVLVPSGPEELPLVVHATTRDGTDVRLLATARVVVPSPDRDRPFVDPRAEGGQALEGVLAATVERNDIAALADALGHAWPDLVAEAERVGRELGLEVAGLGLDELDALLTPHHGRGPD